MSGEDVRCARSSDKVGSSSLVCPDPSPSRLGTGSSSQSSIAAGRRRFLTMPCQSRLSCLIKILLTRFHSLLSFDAVRAFRPASQPPASRQSSGRDSRNLVQHHLCDSKSGWTIRAAGHWHQRHLAVSCALLTRAVVSRLTCPSDPAQASAHRYER